MVRALEGFGSHDPGPSPIAGSALRIWWQGNVPEDNATDGATLTGTWKNVTGRAVDNAQAGLFVRTV